AAGASAKPRCRPFLTPSHWRRRNSWPLDHDRQIHQFRQTTSRLSDQVSANTNKGTNNLNMYCFLGAAEPCSVLSRHPVKARPPSTLPIGEFLHWQLGLLGGAGVSVDSKPRPRRSKPRIGASASPVDLLTLLLRPTRSPGAKLSAQAIST